MQNTRKTIITSIFLLHYY